MKSLFRRICTFKGTIIFLSLSVPFIYITGIILLAALSRKSFNQAALYLFIDPPYAFPWLVDYLIKPLTVVSGLLLIVCFPGIIFTSIFMKNKSNFTLSRFFSLGFMLNIILLFLGTTFIKIFGIAVNRLWLIAVISAETLIGIVVFFRSSLSKIALPLLIEYKDIILRFLLLFFIAVIFILFFQEAILKTLPVNFNYSEKSILEMNPIMIGDLQEEFGIAHHLQRRFLPYWLISYLHKFGVYIYNPHLSYFFNFYAIILFGESYAALNMLFIFFIIGIFLICYEIIALNGGALKNLFFYLGPAFFMLSFLWLFMGSSRRPEFSIMEWPENSFWDPIESLWIFLMIGTIFFMLKKDLVFAFIYAFLSSFCRYESIPYILILIITYYYFFRERRDFLKGFIKLYCLFLFLFIIYSILLCIFQGEGINYLRQLAFDKFFIRFNFLRNNFHFITTIEKEIWPFFSWKNTMHFINKAMLGTYFFLPFFLVPSHEKITNFLSVFGLVYFLSIFSQSFKLLAYSGFLIPIMCINLRRFIYPSIQEKLISFFLYLGFFILGNYFLGL